MSYSNGRLPEDTHGTIVEIIKGLPGVGFKLTSDGDYDINNKKLRNVASPQANNDATTKNYVDVEVSKTLKKHGSDKMDGPLNMDNNRIENIGPGRHNTADALTHVQFEAFYFDINTDDGYIEAQNPIDRKNEKIVNLALPNAESDAASKKYVDNNIKSVNNKFPSYLKKDGSVSLTGDLNMSQKKIINCGPPSNSFDVTRKSYVDNQFSRCLRLDGSNKMTSNLDMNNLQIKHVKDATHNQDAITLKQVNDAIATTSTKNNEYTDEKIAESHISTHENRKNVLKYAMDNGEFTTDFGIKTASLITFNETPHQTNKKAFKIEVEKDGSSGLSEYKCRFDFNLFKLIQNDLSDNYTVCMETYFQTSPFYSYEFSSALLGFEKLNINIDSGLTIKVNSDYKYLRAILNLSPDSTSPNIEKRLCVNFKSNFDNNSPDQLPIYVLIYGIKGEAKNDLDLTIYDYEKAYEVANNQFQMHIPINMNNNKIIRLQGFLPSYIWGVTKKSSLGCDFLTPINTTLNFDKIYILKIMIFAQSTYLLSTNHDLSFYSDKSTFYDLDFSTNKTITVNINRYFENITNIRINFDDSNNKLFKYRIEYSTYHN